MFRHLFAALSIVSLALCAATAVLWVRSYWIADEFIAPHGNWSVATGWTRGMFFRHSIGPLPPAPAYLLRAAPPAPPASGHFQVPASPMRRGRRALGDPGIRHEGGALGFWWFISDGGISAAPMPAGPALPPGGSYGMARFPPMRQYIVPFWAAAILFSVLPSAWLARRRHSSQCRLRSEGRCIRCGYDLRATPTRCPECGTPR